MGEKNDAVEAALSFIYKGKQDYIQNEWNTKGYANFEMPRADYERLVKVLLVGVGELSK